MKSLIILVKTNGWLVEEGRYGQPRIEMVFDDLDKMQAWIAANIDQPPGTQVNKVIGGCDVPGPGEAPVKDAPLRRIPGAMTAQEYQEQTVKEFMAKKAVQAMPLPIYRETP